MGVRVGCVRGRRQSMWNATMELVFLSSITKDIYLIFNKLVFPEKIFSKNC